MPKNTCSSVLRAFTAVTILTLHSSAGRGSAPRPSQDDVDSKIAVHLLDIPDAVGEPDLGED